MFFDLSMLDIHQENTDYSICKIVQCNDQPIKEPGTFLGGSWVVTVWKSSNCRFVILKRAGHFIFTESTDYLT